MLLSKINVLSLLLSGSVALVTPRSEDALAKVEVDTAFTDVLVLIGTPDLPYPGAEEVFYASEDEAEEDDLTRRQASSPTTADQKEAFRLHNAARTKKGLKALLWDKKLETDAKAWAKKLAARDQMVHSTGAERPGQGENLAYAWSTGTISNPITKGTQGWLAEEKNYKNQKIPEGDFGSYGHWTQCMWKSTTKVGIAVASNGKGGFYTVARYSPPGNFVGQRPY